MERINQGAVTALPQDCPHDSLSGDEGPVALLGRMPVRWRCDACDAIVYDDVDENGPRNRANHDGRWDTWAGDGVGP